MIDKGRETPVRESAGLGDEEVAVGEDLGFQRSWWRFERIIWLLFALLLALDLAGAFGRGPLAHARISSPDQALEVRYDRIQRTGTPSMVTITLNREAVRAGQATLLVSDSLIDKLGAQRVLPQPASSTTERGGIRYVFPVTSTPALVRIELQPSGPGVSRFSISAADGPPAAGRIWVMP